MSSTKPLITCSILCYNYGRFLTQAIESCLDQRVDNTLFEVLVIDDGSTDETPIVCGKYADRIRVSRTENLGFAKSLERGLKEARGTYVAYLDADDWWETNKLESIVPHLNEQNLLVVHPLKLVDENGESPRKEIGACGNTSSICVHRDAGLSLLPGTSEIFCRPLLDVGRGITLSSALGNYRIHGKAMTDRSASSAHTEFFAQTAYQTAETLRHLAVHTPFWCDESRRLLELSKWYHAEGVIKDFERLTELEEVSRFAAGWTSMVATMLKAKRGPSQREARLTGRAVRLALKGLLNNVRVVVGE